MSNLATRLAALTPGMLRAILRGIEKEGLRACTDGTLSLTPHPSALGSPLTHPSITTDFSESQLELITAAHPDAEACANELTEIHQVVHRNLGDELVWASSMPCTLPDEERIPLGQYGNSNVGRAKTVYRNGLSRRYGRRMQTISGIHYNFSLPESAWPILQRADGQTGPADTFRDAAYFALIRNFRRWSWLLLYLFGASPAVSEDFADGRPHRLERLAPGTLYLPWATSLRMGPLGYQSDAQASLAVSYNCLSSYAASLTRALTEPYPAYEEIGLRRGDEYFQLATTLLQIENEFYGTIRPKRRIRSGERPLRALIDRGVEYVEVRCMDLDPFEPIGITTDVMRFLDVFLLHCLLSDSPRDTPEEIAENAANQHLTAERGRQQGLRLKRRGEHIPLSDWGAELLAECRAIAEALDAARDTTAYSSALAAAGAALRAPDTTPSARVLAQMIGAHGGSHVAFALDCSIRHKATLREQRLPEETAARYAQLAARSLAEQREIEAADDLAFEAWRRQYLGQAPERTAGDQGIASAM